MDEIKLAVIRELTEKNRITIAELKAARESGSYTEMLEAARKNSSYMDGYADGIAFCTRRLEAALEFAEAKPTEGLQA